MSTLPYDVVERARDAERRGRLDGFARRAAGDLGISTDTFLRSYDVSKDAESKRRMRDQAIDELRSHLPFLRLSDDIVRLLDAAQAVESEFGITINLSISSDRNVNLKLSGVRPKSSDKPSDKSRMSAWTAYQSGLKAGDTFEIVKLGRRDYCDKSRGERFNNLTAHIRDHYSDSQTAAILRRYGQL